MSEFKNLNGFIVKDEEARQALVYSTSETPTGKTWIDGKPIYRKVIQFGPAFDNSSDLEKSVTHGITWDTITKMEGFFRAATTGSGYHNIRNVPVIYNNVRLHEPGGEDDPFYATNNFLVTMSETTIHTSRMDTGGLATQSDVYFIIEYTKPDSE